MKKEEESSQYSSKIKKKKKKNYMETHQSESQTNNFNTHFAEASAEHDLLINFIDPSSEFLFTSK